MEIVIKIPKKEYNIIKKSKGPMTWAEHLIKEGTPLSENHGRIIDESKITSVYYHIETYENGLCLHHTVIDGTNAPTIIEADEAESEE